MIDVLLICFAIAVVVMVVVHLGPPVVIIVASVGRLVPAARLILPVAHLDIRAGGAFVYLSVRGVAIIGIACCHLFDEVSAVSGVFASIIIRPASALLVPIVVAMIDVVVDYLFLRLFGVVDVLEIV